VAKTWHGKFQEKIAQGGLFNAEKKLTEKGRGKKRITGICPGTDLKKIHPLENHGEIKKKEDKKVFAGEKRTIRAAKKGVRLNQ